MEGMLYCFMGLTGAADLVRREIPGWMFWIFGIAGVMGRLMFAPAAVAAEPSGTAVLIAAGGIACSMAAGVFLLLLSRFVGGAVGEGDGWFFVVTGIYVTWKTNLALLSYGLLLCSVYGMGLLVWGNIRGISVRKKKIPFLPFVCLAGLLMASGYLWEV